MPDLPNNSHYVIGWFREDGDFDVVAAVNNYQFADDGQTLRAIVAVIQASMPDSESIVAIRREELIDVIELEEDNKPDEAWTYQPQLYNGG